MIAPPTARLDAGVTFLAPTIPVHVFDADRPGPTALIQGGIHGDEVAGVHAIEELLEAGLRPTVGRLILVPRMNPAAVRVRERTAPGGLDLNRCFPGDADGAAEERLAHAFFQLVLHERPALVATLHESDKRHHPDIRASFGQTLVYGVDPCPPELTAIVDALNTGIVHPYERWATHSFPVPTSSTEQIVDAVGCLGVCVETWKGFALERRVAMQREVVRRLLDAVGVVPLSAPPTA